MGSSRRQTILVLMGGIALVALTAVLLVVMVRGSQPPNHSSRRTAPPTISASNGDISILGKSIERSCAWNGRHLATKCQVAVQVSGPGGDQTLVLTLPTYRYVTSPSPPYDVTQQRGPAASCKAQIPAAQAGSSVRAGCTIVAPAGYGFASSSPNDLQVAVAK